MKTVPMEETEPMEKLQAQECHWWVRSISPTVSSSAWWEWWCRNSKMASSRLCRSANSQKRVRLRAFSMYSFRLKKLTYGVPEPWLWSTKKTFNTLWATRINDSPVTPRFRFFAMDSDMSWQAVNLEEVLWEETPSFAQQILAEMETLLQRNKNLSKKMMTVLAHKMW